jgi:uncharacterized protein YndB with AHSA1/START domain
MSKTVPVKSIHRYNVSAERVYETLLDASKAKKFMFVTVSGKMIRAEIDPKVGGGFVFVERRPGGDAAHFGKYVTLQKPNKIQFRFAVQENAKESDLISIEITPLKQGCEVTLTHDVKEEFAHLEERIQEGWDGILDGLGASLRS